MGGFPQPVTGPLINAILYISTSLLGCISGIIIGCITPLVALIRGQLPPFLAPMVPFIMIGNGLLVVIYYFIASRKRNKSPIKQITKYIAILFASVLKFLFLSISFKIVAPLIISNDIPHKLTLLMSTPQLYSALFGGIIALIILEILFRSGLLEKYEFN